MRRIDVNVLSIPSWADANLPESHPYQGPELQLVKSALLYGDHIQLFNQVYYEAAVRKSPTWEALPLEFRLETAKHMLAIGVPNRIADWLGANNDNYSHFVRTGEIVGECGHMLQWGLISRDAREAFYESRGTQHREPPDADAILGLQSLDLISIHSSVYDLDLADAPELELPLLENYVPGEIDIASIFSKRIWKIWSTPNAFPMFDGYLGFWAEQLSRQHPAAHGRGSGRQRELALADQFFGCLPGFPRATIDEVLDIRSELQDSLGRFRLALARICEQLADIGGADEFHGEAHSLWVSEVLPAVQEIEDSVKTNKYLYQLTEHFLTRPDGLVAGGGLIVGAMTAPDVPRLVASAAATALPAARALWESWKGNAAIKRNQFHFIYSLNRRLD